MVLMVVDTQKLLVNKELFNLENFIENIKNLIDKARMHQVEVIYIVHDDEDGGELTKGKEGFEVYEEFAPSEHEKIFVKSVNSPFRNMDLLRYLNEKKQTDIMVVGLQTDKCIDATVKCGFEHRFNIIVPAYCNTTVDNEFMSAEKSYRYYNEFMWNGRYAKCISLEETIDEISRGEYNEIK